MSRQILPNVAPEASGARHSPQSPLQSDASRSPPGANGSISGGGGGGGMADGLGLSSKVTYAKRGKITLVACVPCRKRKSKCDGKRPVCSQCSARDGTCIYDMTDEQRKLTYLRDNVEQLQERSNSLQSLLHTVQTASDEEAAEVFRRLRSGTDIQIVAEQVQAGQLLSGVGSRDLDQHSQRPTPRESLRAVQNEQIVNVLAELEHGASMEVLRRLHNRDDIASILDDVQNGNLTPPPPNNPVLRQSSTLDGNRHGTAGFGTMVQEDTNHVSSKQPEDGFIDSHINHPWTTVTKDSEFIEHLLNLYFTWQHCFFHNFPQSLFRADMANRRTKYCSEALVNAICAAGCFLSTREKARQDRGDGQTLVASFYDEAKKHIERDQRMCITTISAICLLSYVDGTRAQLSSLWMLSGRSTLIALDIGLHLRRKERSGFGTAEEEDEYSREDLARSRSFWGCFHTDSVTSFILGRAPIFDSSSITTELPLIDPDEDSEPWQAYEMNIPNRPGARGTTFHQIAKLSKIVNSTLLLFYAPRVPLSGASLLEEFEKYQEFFAQLPPIVSSTHNAPPHVLCLHMYFHAAVLSLFRPFLYATIIDSNIIPREICRTAANTISDLWQQHRTLYGLTGIYMFQVHCLLTACTIHIVNIPTISSTKYLTYACNMFHDLTPRNDWARTALETLRNLAEKWRLILPLDVEDALYRESDRSRLNHPDNMGGPVGGHGRDHAMIDHGRRYSSSAGQGASSSNSRFVQQYMDRQSQGLPPPPQSSHEQLHMSRQESDGAQIPSKRSTGPSPQGEAAVSHNGKRQRIHSSHTSQHHPTALRYRHPDETRNSSHSTSHSQSDSSSQQPRSPASASSYLYSPLAHQSVPLLQPVRLLASASASSSSLATRADSSGASSLSNQRDSSSSSSLGPKRDGRSGGLNGSRDDGDASVRQMQDQVDGLTFAEDWRNPFLGISVGQN